MAQIGITIQHFVAGTNANDVVPRYLQSGNYAEKLSVAKTISNAMDVGAPSNFIRIQELFGNDFENLKKKKLTGFPLQMLKPKQPWNSSSKAWL